MCIAAKGRRHIVADAPRTARRGTKKLDCGWPTRRRDGEKPLVVGGGGAVAVAADDNGAAVVAGEARRIEKGSHDAFQGRASEKVPGELGVDSRSWWAELARQPCRTESS